MQVKKHFIIMCTLNLTLFAYTLKSNFCTVLICTEFLRNAPPRLIEEEEGFISFGNIPRVVKVINSNTVHNIGVPKATQLEHYICREMSGSTAVKMFLCFSFCYIVFFFRGRKSGIGQMF